MAKELKKMIKDQTPTKEQLKAMAFDLIKGLIPNIPLILQYHRSENHNHFV